MDKRTGIRHERIGQLDVTGQFITFLKVLRCYRRRHLDDV